MLKEKTENITIVQFGEITYARATVIFFNRKNKKSILYVEGTCFGRKMKPIKVNILIDQKKHQCPYCGKDILWFIEKSKVDILDYFPSINTLSVRIETPCECGVTNTFVLLLPLTEFEEEKKEK